MKQYLLLALLVGDRVFTVIGLALAPDTLVYYTPTHQRLLDTFRFLP